MYKNDKLDLSFLTYIIEDNNQHKHPVQWSITTWQAKLYMTNCGMTI